MRGRILSARVLVMVMLAALVAVPLVQAQRGGVWAAPARDGGGGADRPGAFPTQSIQPLIVSPFANRRGPRECCGRSGAFFGSRNCASVIPVYYPSYYDNGPESLYGSAAYSPAVNGPTLQVVTGYPQNSAGPQSQPSREALLEKRLDEQALELDQLRRDRSATSAPQASGSVENEELQPTTILVFKDKRPAEMIHNYAIVGSNLFVMGRGHRKIPLTDLDLVRTARANEDAGLEFRMPGTPSVKLRSGLGIDR